MLCRQTHIYVPVMRHALSRLLLTLWCAAVVGEPKNDLGNGEVIDLGNQQGDELIYSKFRELNVFYDSRHPSPVNFSTSQLKSHHLNKRCILWQPENAINSFLSREFAAITGTNNIFVSSPCLGSDSLGNFLGAYFENMICALLSGAHYVTVAKVYDPATRHAPSAFISHLPDIVVHKSPSTREQSVQLVKKHCTCDLNCHENLDAAWVKGVDTIRPIILGALKHHLSVNFRNLTAASAEPVIPDVAIHYRFEYCMFPLEYSI